MPQASQAAPAANPQAEADAQSLRQHNTGHLHIRFAVAMALFHALAIAAFFYFRWSSLLVFAILWFLGTNLGIGVSYHRQLTHGSFTSPKWVEYALAICATLALEGGPLFWVAVHRLHHQVSDREGDPHSPRDGAWWSHMGWMLWGSIHNHNPMLRRYAPDLYKQPFYIWLSRLHWVPITLVGIALAWFGGSAGHRGLSWVLWGVFLRVTMGWHVTWLVNSATHIWGTRRFTTRDDSRNNWWVAILSGGEGWHNNHHAHPVSAAHGMAWYEFDLNYLSIRALGLLGLAKKIKVQGPQHHPGSSQARILHP